MELFSQLEGQETAKQNLQRSLARGTVHHAYLFEGPAGVGKFLGALALAQALVCEQRRGALACGTCSACERAVLREGERRPRHPDVAVVARGLYEPGVIGRKTPESQEISVDQIRTVVLAHAAYGPHEGHARVFLLRGADELGVSAGNALLKMLEEPLPRTHFVLISDQPEKVLPTLRSRTLSVRFAPLSDSVLSRLLAARGVDESEISELVASAAGSLEMALALRDREGQAQEQEFVEAVELATRERGATALLALSDSVKGQKEILERNLRALGRSFVRAAHRAAEAGEDPERPAQRHAIVREALLKLTRNAAPPLVVESMVLALRRF